MEAFGEWVVVELISDTLEKQNGIYVHTLNQPNNLGRVVAVGPCTTGIEDPETYERTLLLTPGDEIYFNASKVIPMGTREGVELYGMNDDEIIAIRKKAEARMAPVLELKNGKAKQTQDANADSQGSSEAPL